MAMDAVPAALRTQLGAEATGGLLQLFDQMQRKWETDVIAVCTDRFECRLVEEISKVRVDMAHLESSLKQEIGRCEATLRQEMAAGRVELLKWCFLFWIGQVIAITGILGVMLRLYRT